MIFNVIIVGFCDCAVVRQNPTNIRHSSSVGAAITYKPKGVKTQYTRQWSVWDRMKQTPTTGHQLHQHFKLKPLVGQIRPPVCKLLVCLRDYFVETNEKVRQQGLWIVRCRSDSIHKSSSTIYEPNHNSYILI